jgi:hypothetical protein
MGGCPENSKVGLFINNTAHSNGKYGLRIFHKMMPRKNPCRPIIFDGKNRKNPFWKNPLQEFRFLNLTAWKNARNGAIAEEIADVKFFNFKTADNGLAGMEVTKSNFVFDDRTMFLDCLVVGASRGNGNRG